MRVILLLIIVLMIMFYPYFDRDSAGYVELQDPDYSIYEEMK